MTLLLALSVVAAVPAAAAGADNAGVVYAVDDVEDDEETSTENDSDVRPGERLSGAIGVQMAEIDGEVESRAFGLTIAEAASDDARADVVAEKLRENQQRLADLEERKQELEEEREAGDVSVGKYQAEIATLAQEIDNLERTTNQSAEAAEDLPAEKLEERGVNASAIDQLRQQASELGGKEVSEIARGIAGERTGQAAGQPDHVGERGNQGQRGEQGDTESGDANEAIDRAEQEIAAAEERIDSAERQVTDGDTEAQSSLEEARAELANAEEALAEARNLADEDADAGIDRAEASLEHAKNAVDHAENATEQAGIHGGTNGTSDSGTEDGSNTGEDGY